MNPACKDCRFWSARNREPDDVIGYCVRFPPPNSDGEFPRVAKEEWCGEFCSREAPKPPPISAEITFHKGEEHTAIALKK